MTALFDAMNNLLRGQRFKDNEELQQCPSFGVQYSKAWFFENIWKLPVCWQWCTDLGGKYIEHAKV